MPSERFALAPGAVVSGRATVEASNCRQDMCICRSELRSSYGRLCDGPLREVRRVGQQILRRGSSERHRAYARCAVHQCHCPGRRKGASLRHAGKRDIRPDRSGQRRSRQLCTLDSCAIQAAAPRSMS
jgi:hypothetical protein